jgi:hypothetical protein
MGLFAKLFGKKDQQNNDELVYDLDLIPEVTIDDVDVISMSQGSFRRKTPAEERIRVTLTMKKSTFEALRRFCTETNANASQALRSGFRFAEQPFRKNTRLIKDFDE